MQTPQLSPLPNMTQFSTHGSVFPVAMRSQHLTRLQPMTQQAHIQPSLFIRPQFPSSFVTHNAGSEITPDGAPVSAAITPSSLAEMASIISPVSKRRAESFAIEEIKVLLQEIEKRKHVLLSASPAAHRLKRRAWEEVSNSMALRWPQETRRTADQIKKKWENLVSKTKRKVREGHMTPDLDWSETNTLIMQFLANHTAALRVRSSMHGSEFQAISSSSSQIMKYCSDVCTQPAMNQLCLPNQPALSQTFACQSLPSSTQMDGLLPQFPSSIAPYSASNEFGATLSFHPKMTGSTTAHRIITPETVLNDAGTSGLNIRYPMKVKVELEDSPVPGPVGDGEGIDVMPQLESGSSNPQTVDGINSFHTSCTSNGMPNLTTLISNPGETSNLTSEFMGFGLPIDESLLPALAINSSIFNLKSSSPQAVHKLQEELMNQARMEHKARMEVLRLQQQAWGLQVELLKSQVRRAKPSHRSYPNQGGMLGSVRNSLDSKQTNHAY